MTLVKNICEFIFTIILTIFLFLTGIGSIIIRIEEKRAEDCRCQSRASVDETETKEKV